MQSHRPIRDVFKLAVGCLVAILFINVSGCARTDSDHTAATDVTSRGAVAKANVQPAFEDSDQVSDDHRTLDRSSDLSLDEPTNAKPLSVAAAFSPKQAGPGDTITLEVRAKTARGWHIYAVDKPTGVSVATSLKLTLPQGVTASGPWRLPEPELDISGGSPTFVYHGELSFRRELRVAKDIAAAQYSVTCDFGYQACTAASCLAPNKIRLTVPLTIVPRDP